MSAPFLTKERRQEIAAREKAATPGKWEQDIDLYGGSMAYVIVLPVDPRDPPGDGPDKILAPGWTREVAKANADFIEAAREDVPALLAENEALRRLVRELLRLAPTCERCQSAATHKSKHGFLLCWEHASQTTAAAEPRLVAVREAVAAGLLEEETQP